MVPSRRAPSPPLPEDSNHSLDNVNVENCFNPMLPRRTAPTPPTGWREPPVTVQEVVDEVNDSLALEVLPVERSPHTPVDFDTNHLLIAAQDSLRMFEEYKMNGSFSRSTNTSVTKTPFYSTTKSLPSNSFRSPLLMTPVTTSTQINARSMCSKHSMVDYVHKSLKKNSRWISEERDNLQWEHSRRISQFQS
jgi:hypothetical protein